MNKSPNNKKSAIILAGGKGSRMGCTDKAFLSYKGRYFIDYLIEKVSNFDEIIIVSNNLNSYKKYRERGVIVVEDIFKEIGPLGGIHSGLTHCSYDEALVISCDTPFLELSFLEYLRTLRGDHHIAIPKHESNREPLCSLYKKSILNNIEENIKEEKYKIAFLFNELDISWIMVNNLNHSQIIINGFNNINTLTDLKNVGGYL